VAARQSGVPFDSLPSHARCILAHNNTGRAWAIIRLDQDATETDDPHERITADLDARFGASFSLPLASAKAR
jgi:hypothetical protein